MISFSTRTAIQLLSAITMVAATAFSPPEGTPAPTVAATVAATTVVAAAEAAPTTATTPPEGTPAPSATASVTATVIATTATTTAMNTSAFVTITVTPDWFPEETMWTFTDEATQEELYRQDYGSTNWTEAESTVTFNLPEGNYQLEVGDSAGNGMCCALGNGAIVIMASSSSSSGMSSSSTTDASSTNTEWEFAGMFSNFIFFDLEVGADGVVQVSASYTDSTPDIEVDDETNNATTMEDDMEESKTIPDTTTTPPATDTDVINATEEGGDPKDDSDWPGLFSTSVERSVTLNVKFNDRPEDIQISFHEMDQTYYNTGWIERFAYNGTAEDANALFTHPLDELRSGIYYFQVMDTSGQQRSLFGVDGGWATVTNKTDVLFETNAATDVTTRTANRVGVSLVVRRTGAWTSVWKTGLVDVHE